MSRRRLRQRLNPAGLVRLSMSLSQGSRLEPSEVTATLGADGMGEVYRGHDGRLKRDVALKILADALTRC